MEHLRGIDLSSFSSPSMEGSDLLNSLTAASPIEMNALLTNQLQVIQYENPSLPYHAVLRRFSETTPQRVPSAVQTTVIAALNSEDREVVSAASNSLLLLNLKSVFSGISPYLSNDEMENEEVLHSAVTSVLEGFSLPIKHKVAQYVHHHARRGAEKYIRSRENIPESMAVKNVYTTIMRGYNEARDDYPDGIPESVLQRLAEQNEQPNLSVDTIRTYYSFLDWIENPSPNQEPSPHERIAHLILYEDLQYVLARLKPKEREVIERSFGFLFYEEQTPAQIAEVLHLAPETVSRIKREAVRKLPRMRDGEFADLLYEYYREYVGFF